MPPATATPRGTSPTRRRGGGTSPLARRALAAEEGAMAIPPLALRMPLLPAPADADADVDADAPTATAPTRPRTAAVVVALALALGIVLGGAAAGAALGLRWAVSGSGGGGGASGPAPTPPPPPPPLPPPTPPLSPQLLLRPPPHVVAHRGASALLPEHTLPAYSAAIAAGADFVECDVHLTADLQPICRHDADLSATTDALERFPERKRTREVDGTRVTGLFACDFTLAEVQSLRARQRWPDDRGSQHDGAYGVATLDELLALVAQGAAGGGRVVGIFPETKHAAWHDAIFAERWRRREPRLMAGLREMLRESGSGGGAEDRSNGRRLLERVVVARLVKGGYIAGGGAPSSAGGDAWRARPAYVQSFEIESLRAVDVLAQRALLRMQEGGGEAPAAAAAAASAAVAGARLPAVLPRTRRARGSNGSTKNNNAVPLVLLLGGWPGWRTADTGETLERQLASLESTWAREVDGAGPWKESLFEVAKKGGAQEADAAAAAAHGGDVAAAEAASSSSSSPPSSPPTPSGLLSRLKAAGLVVHAYSVRPEAKYVLPGFGGRAEREMAALFLGGGDGGGGEGGGGVDGAFADHPAAMVGFLVGQGLRGGASG